MPASVFEIWCKGTAFLGGMQVQMHRKCKVLGCKCTENAKNDYFS